MKCLETRRQPDGTVRRRYRDALGIIHHTVEIPREVWRALPQGVLQDRLASRKVAVARLRLKARGLQLVAQGWKPEAVAQELNVTARAVQRWAAKAK